MRRRCRRCPSPRSPWPRTGPPRCLASTPVRRWLLRVAPGTPSLTTRDKIQHLEQRIYTDSVEYSVKFIADLILVIQKVVKSNDIYLLKKCLVLTLYQNVAMIACSLAQQCRAPCPWRRRRSWRSRARTTWTSNSQSTRTRSNSYKVGHSGEKD